MKKYKKNNIIGIYADESCAASTCLRDKFIADSDVVPLSSFRSLITDASVDPTRIGGLRKRPSMR